MCFLSRMAVLALAYLASGLCVSAADLSTLGFLHNPQQAYERALAEDKELLVDFSTDWCVWCRRLEADVFPSADFQAFAAERVLLSVDAEKGDGIALAQRYHVSGFPTLILMAPDGSEIDRLVGYLPAEAFVQLFEDYSNGIGTLSALQESLAQSPHDLALKLQIAQKLDDRGQVRDAHGLLQEIIEQDPLNETGYAAEASVALAMAEYQLQESTKGLEDVLLRYPGLEAGPQIYLMLIGIAAREQAHKRMEVLFTRAVEDYPQNIDLLGSFAWFSADLGWDLDRALQMAMKAVELAPEDSNVLDTLAEVQFRSGRRSAAQKTIARALELSPDDEHLQQQQQRFQEE